MEVGQRVRIKNTNSIWDDKEGIIEYIDDYNVTVFVDFLPEEGKRVRQDFNIENLELINKEIPIDESIKNNIFCYRSIGFKEFDDLLKGKIIYGQYNNKNEFQNDSSLKNVVCFFINPIRWKDSKHKIMIECKFNDSDISKGQGTYYASKDFEKSKIWSGKRGRVKYNLKELYVSKYDISNLKSIVVEDNIEDELLNANLSFTYIEEFKKLITNNNIQIKQFKELK